MYALLTSYANKARLSVEEAEAGTSLPRAPRPLAEKLQRLREPPSCRLDAETFVAGELLHLVALQAG